MLKAAIQAVLARKLSRGAASAICFPRSSVLLPQFLYFCTLWAGGAHARPWVLRQGVSFQRVYSPPKCSCSFHILQSSDFVFNVQQFNLSLMVVYSKYKYSTGLATRLHGYLFLLCNLWEEGPRPRARTSRQGASC